MAFLLYRWHQSTGTALYLVGLDYPHSVSPQGVSLNSKPEADKSKIMVTSSNRDERQERYTRNCATALWAVKVKAEIDCFFMTVWSCLMKNHILKGEIVVL